MVAQLRLQVADAGDDGQQLVDGVVAQVVAGGVGRAALRDDLHLDTALVPAIDLHPRWLADDDEVGPHALRFDQRVGGDAVAPLLHVAEVVGRPAVEQAEFAGQRQAVDHARRGAFLVARAAREQHTVLDLADEGVPAPGLRVADADGVNVAVVEQDAGAVADTAQDVAHLVEADLVKAELAHLRADALADWANQAVVGGNRDDVAHELDNRVVLRRDAVTDGRDDFRGNRHSASYRGGLNPQTRIIPRLHK